MSDTCSSEPSSPVTLETLFQELDSFEGAIPLEVLKDKLTRLSLSKEELGPWRQFSDCRYLRNLVHQGPSYQALLLCWRSGQRSPIHDHKGSACGMKVIEGKATETIFCRAATGQIYATSSLERSQGEVAASFDADIHQISNLQEECLVTLHVYSPPLLSMGTYSLSDTTVTQFSDWIDSFVDGGGI